MVEYIKKSVVISELIAIENRANRDEGNYKKSGEKLYRDLCETEIRLGKIPAADVAPVKHAHWIIWEPPEELKDRMQRGYVCSECERTVAFILHGIEPLPPVLFGRLIYQYCPHCGAKMDEEEQQ